MKPHIKIDTTILDNPRIKTLTFDDIGVYLMLLALAAKRDHRDINRQPTDAIGHAATIARELGCDLLLLTESLCRLENAGFIRHGDLSCWYITTTRTQEATRDHEATV